MTILKKGDDNLFEDLFEGEPKLALIMMNDTMRSGIILHQIIDDISDEGTGFNNYHTEIDSVMGSIVNEEGSVEVILDDAIHIPKREDNIDYLEKSLTKWASVKRTTESPHVLVASTIGGRLAKEIQSYLDYIIDVNKGNINVFRVEFAPDEAKGRIELKPISHNVIDWR